VIFNIGFWGLDIAAVHTAPRFGAATYRLLMLSIPYNAARAGLPKKRPAIEGSEVERHVKHLVEPNFKWCRDFDRLAISGMAYHAAEHVSQGFNN
jgi:hypothetical protein